MNELENEVLFC